MHAKLRIIKFGSPNCPVHPAYSQMRVLWRVVPTALAYATQLRQPGTIQRAGTGARSSLLSASAAGVVIGDPRLSELRSQMEACGVHALVVPSGDAHLSEYVHPCYDRRAFISGFTGSAGTVLVTADEALLWTDGRYFLQAEDELGDEWTLMREQQKGVPTLEAWLKNLPDGAVVGIDPYVHSVKAAEGLKKAVAERGLELKALPTNLVDHVWAERPGPPSGAARVMPLEVAGVGVPEKMAAVRRAAADAGADAYLACALDEVAWLLNLRGDDVPHCPVLQAYCLVEADGATLFVDAAKLPADAVAELSAMGVRHAPYDGVEAALRTLREAGGKAMFDPALANYGLYLAAEGAAVLAPSPVALPKATKNDAELAGMLDAHLRDGAALAKFYAWLRRTVVAEATPISEAQLSQRLRAFREAEGAQDVSFPTIAGSGANGAIIHYNCEAVAAFAGEDVTAIIDGTQMLLLDSGGQYATGTTDVTRTLHLGTPTPWQRECWTRVLKGHIALSSQIFPEGTPGVALDALARSALWQVGLDYLHGTGHGVGAALNVHEGPQSIRSQLTDASKVALQPGMILSNEPGYYEAGAFGIRIENLLVVRPRETPHAAAHSNGKTFLGFEPLTHVPLQQSLLDHSLLTAAERGWIDAYHAQVWERVSPLLDEGCEGREWLREATQPLGVPAGVAA